MMDAKKVVQMPIPPKESALVVSVLADVKPEAIKWLWRGVLALGKLTLVGGNPGVGKSQVASSITAIVSRGEAFPGGTHGKAGSVLFVGVEDGLADTLRPRMEAAGADLNKVHVLQGKREYTGRGEEVISLLDVTKDLVQLSELLDELGDVRLIIFDPVNDYVGDGKQNDNAEMRKALVPLAAFAERHQVAILAITHLKKSSGMGEPIDAFISSRAFTGVARCVFAVAKDNNDELNRLFISVKNNIEKDVGGYSFSIESATTKESIQTSRVKWNKEVITKTANELMRDTLNNEERSSINDAKLFLQEWFWRECRIGSKEMEKEGRDAGVAYRTLERARKALGAMSRKGAEGWYWFLPDHVRAELYKGRAEAEEIASSPPSPPSPPTSNTVEGLGGVDQA